jgi:hypothetical protein
MRCAAFRLHGYHARIPSPAFPMSEFEYITVLLSIILGLAVTQLLAGFARLLRDGRSLTPAWWIFVLIAMLLLANLQIWWVSHEWRRVEEWTFLAYAAFMILPVLMYLLAYLLLPDNLHLTGHELAREFVDHRKPFYTCLALVPLASFLQERLLTGHLPSASLDTGFRLVFLAIAVPGFLWRQTRVQACVALLALLNMATYTGVLFTQMR